MTHSTYQSDYEKKRKLLKCQVCKKKAFRRRLCKQCLTIEIFPTFHCTVNKCISPVFALTLCQKHYKHYHESCILCKNSLYCRNLCRKHYDLCRKNGNFPAVKKCSDCDKNVYIGNKCLHHFKKQFISSCILVGCNNKPYKKNMCCSHYFKERRKNSKY